MNIRIPKGRYKKVRWVQNFLVKTSILKFQSIRKNLQSLIYLLIVVISILKNILITMKLLRTIQR
nr:MAG TPA: hypothetical protein [Crassvirales sp.]